MKSLAYFAFISYTVNPCHNITGSSSSRTHGLALELKAPCLSHWTSHGHDSHTATGFGRCPRRSTTVLSPSWELSSKSQLWNRHESMFHWLTSESPDAHIDSIIKSLHGMLRSSQVISSRVRTGWGPCTRTSRGFSFTLQTGALWSWDRSCTRGSAWNLRWRKHATNIYRCSLTK